MLLVSLSGGGEGGYWWTQILELSLRFHPWDSSTTCLCNFFPRLCRRKPSSCRAFWLSCPRLSNAHWRREGWICHHWGKLSMYEPSGSLHTGTPRIWFLNNTTTKLINVLPLLKELQLKIFLALLQETRDRTWNSQMRWRYCYSSLRLIIIQCQKWWWWWWWWWWEGSWRMKSHHHKDQPPPSIVM